MQPIQCRRGLQVVKTVIAFIEGLLRRDISLRVKERVYQVAFLFLVLFAVVVIYNDLVKTLPGLAQRLP